MSRKGTIALVVAAVFLGALAGQLIAPQPASAVAREIIELQQSVAQLLQGQQDMRSAMDQRLAELRTVVNQTLDSQSRVNTEMGALQKTFQDAQANTGARVDTLATQSQGLSDNMQDLQARVGKLSQQLTDIQNLLQSIDAKLPGSSTAGGGTAPGAGSSAPSSMAQPPSVPSPISSDTLYQNALRDFSSGRNDLARQEFGDFLKNFSSSDLAGNAQFYLGEISYAQGDYQNAIAAYDLVLVNYPKSFKIAAASLKKGEAMLAMGEKASALRQFRSVVSKFPGTDEARRAQVHVQNLSPRTPPASKPQ
jgi:tol-pal system protein YbgF